MSKRIGTSRKPTKRPVVVVAGEDGNDRKSLAALLEHYCPSMGGRLVEIKDSVRLRTASGAELDRRVHTLYGKARAKAELERSALACLFVHEDWDAVESADAEQARRRVQESLVRITGRSHYVLAAWEAEAWLLMLPESVTAAFSSWSVPKRYRSVDTGLVHDPKRVIRTEVSSSARRYREADSVAILQLGVRNGEVSQPSGTNASWSALRKSANTCCATHVSSLR